MNDSGRESGLTLNVWEYSNVSLDMAKVIVDLDAKMTLRGHLVAHLIVMWLFSSGAPYLRNVKFVS